MEKRCYLMPYGLNLRFFGRTKELQALKDHLYEQGGTRLRAMGIHGLGGVGKTQLALQYANTSLHLYNIIAWIPADTQANIVHALSSLARKLGLVDKASEDDPENVCRVRDWLNTTWEPFLLIFDGVENLELLDQIWPASDDGSIIITTRSPSVASGRTSATLALRSFPKETRREALRFLSGLDSSDSKETAAARRICEHTGGNPLSMMQIANFIRDRGSSYGEVGEILRDSAQKLYTRIGPPAEYQHTVLSAWETSFQRLSPEATALLNLLVFFQPRSIPEQLITNNEAEIQHTQLDFAFDKFA
jgi:hypothetical protein